MFYVTGPALLDLPLEKALDQLPPQKGLDVQLRLSHLPAYDILSTRPISYFTVALLLSVY